MSVADRCTAERGRRVVVVGLGNIGSHLVTHLARDRTVGELLLIDRDSYDATNLATQDITPGDVGRAKAQVQAALAQRIAPALRVRAIVRPIDDVPLGCLRGDVIAACVDSRAARRDLNQAAWHLGVPLVDAGVHAEGLLARVSVYLPGPNNPCLECAWHGPVDYDLAEQTYPCGGAAAESAPTHAPSSLGALAASLQATEISRLLAGDIDCVTPGRQIVIDARHHRSYVSTFRRNPGCRLADHNVWDLENLESGAEHLPLEHILDVHDHENGKGAASLWVDGVPFVTNLTCGTCGYRRSLLRLRTSLRQRDRHCGCCGAPMVAAAFDYVERLRVTDIPAADRRRPLRSLGIQRGEVVNISRATTVGHYVIPDDWK